MGKFFGRLITGLAIYAMVSAVMLTFGVALSARGIVAEFTWVREIQRYLYPSGRNIWQTQADCVVYDEQLIFKPKNGSCEFSNIEFETKLNFSDYGRSTGVKPAGDPIVVLGDSHAMGWGVNDEETFSAQLEKRLGRPVYNLAVAGYGTARELLRFEKSAFRANVKTVIIQYCNNDRKENLAFQIHPSSEVSEKFKIIQSKGNSNDFWARVQHFGKAYRFSFSWPFRLIGKAFKGDTDTIEFGPHYEALINTLKKSSGLENKQLIIFYSNAHGKRFRHFPAGRDKQLPNVYFVDLELDPSDYYILDDHLNSAGHKKIAAKLADLLRTQGVKQL